MCWRTIMNLLLLKVDDLYVFLCRNLRFLFFIFLPFTLIWVNLIVIRKFLGELGKLLRQVSHLAIHLNAFLQCLIEVIVYCFVYLDYHLRCCFFLEHVNQGAFWVLLSLIAVSIGTALLWHVDLPLLLRWRLGLLDFLFILLILRHLLLLLLCLSKNNRIDFVLFDFIILIIY